MLNKRIYIGLVDEGEWLLANQIHSGSKFIFDTVDKMRYNSWAMNCISILEPVAKKHSDRINQIYSPEHPTVNIVEQILGILKSAVTYLDLKDDYENMPQVTVNPPEDKFKKSIKSERADDSFGAASGEVDQRKVFVVHGRNLGARDSIFTFLRALGLEPIEWSEAIQLSKKTNPFIGEVLDAAFAHAQAILVLMTPDDIAYLRPDLQGEDDPTHEKSPTPQARPNVLFEAGMAMGRFPERTVLLELGNLRPFSDIGGRHVVKLTNSTQRRQDVADRLQMAGCAVKISGRDWHTAGDFEDCISSKLPNLVEPASTSAVSEPPSVFARLLPKMRDLFNEMKSDLESDTSGVVREFIVLPSSSDGISSSKPRFIYYENKHPYLQNKLDLLIENSLIVDVTTKNIPIYRMTELFVESLLAMKQQAANGE
jgi:predicted nucleotide-binding protein